MNTDRLIKTFFELVRIDSPTGEETSLAAYLVKRLKDLGLQPKIDDQGAVFVTKEGRGEPLLLSAHMDTVEPGREIQPTIADGYIVSDGTTILGADNKIAIACILELLEVLKDTSEHQTLELLFTVFEETTMDGAIKFDYSQIKSKTGYCFDAPNPVGTLITASPYYDRFDIKLIGTAAHASLPHEAINAVHILRDVLNAMQLGKLDEETICNIGIINGGHVRNTIPGEIHLQGEIRSFNEQTMAMIKEKIQEDVNQIIQKYHASVEYDWVRENPGYVHDTSHPFFQKTMAIFKEQGLSASLDAPWSISDANIFNDKGLLCINLSDGGEFAHTVRERMAITEFEKLCKVMLALVV